jgi:DNA polymerase-1
MSGHDPNSTPQCSRSAEGVKRGKPKKCFRQRDFLPRVESAGGNGTCAGRTYHHAFRKGFGLLQCAQMRDSLYLIDGHAQMYRCYYAPFRDLSSPSGVPTRATYVFSQMLLSLIREKKPTHLAMVIDLAGEKTFRDEIFPEYRANREPPPEDFPPQEQRILRIVRAAGVPVLSRPRYEADDIIATLVEQARGRDMDVYLVSKDKDLEQLLSDRVRMYDPNKDEVIDVARMMAEKGYGPEHAVEVQTLTGDTVDNVPGVKGEGSGVFCDEKR